MKSKTELLADIDRVTAERDALRAKLANASGFLERVSSSRNYPIGYSTKDEILAFLSATSTTEPDHE